MPAWFFLFVLAVVAILFIGLPWLVFHYVTRWKTAATLNGPDERLLEELHALARRMDERVRTVERIVAAENPNWAEIARDPAAPIANDSQADTGKDTLRRIK